jgi:serine/threonine-protein kinase HipA
MSSEAVALRVRLATDHGDIDVGRAYVNTHRTSPSTSFEYDDRHLASSGAWAVSPDLALGQRTVTTGLPGTFADSAPDRWGRMLIERRIRSEALAADRTPPTVTEVDYLLGVSDASRQGALRFRTETDGPFLAESGDVPPMVDLPALLTAADQVSRLGVDDVAAVRALLDAGSASLGGARPKASVRDRDRLMIAKFPHRSGR